MLSQVWGKTVIKKDCTFLIYEGDVFISLIILALQILMLTSSVIFFFFSNIFSKEGCMAVTTQVN